MFRIFLETVYLYEHDRRNLENSAAENLSLYRGQQIPRLKLSLHKRSPFFLSFLENGIDHKTNLYLRNLAFE